MHGLSVSPVVENRFQNEFESWLLNEAIVKIKANTSTQLSKININ